jgi:hypothetical protein
VRQAVREDASYLLAPSRLRIEVPAGVALVVIRVRHDVGDETFVLTLIALRDHDAGLYGEPILDGCLDSP